MPIALLGFGNVGRALAKLLILKQEELNYRYNIAFSIVGISTKRHGAVIDPRGIDIHNAIRLIEMGDSLASLSALPTPVDNVNFIRSTGAKVLFENTPVSYSDGQPAIDHIRTALECGMHAITANKGPVVHAYEALLDLAESKGVCFLFESTVMDGAPIFSMWRESLPAGTIFAFRGVLNSTTNLILSLMEEGKTFAEAVEHAQAIGIAETDPSGDIDGWDAAIKVAALVTVLMGIPLKPDRVDRKGIGQISESTIERSLKDGKRWKLICMAKRDGDQVQASVSPQELESSSPLFNVMGTSSAVTFQSDILGDLTIFEEDPSPATTAYGLLADFINAVRSK
ncbi:MAG: homoserine dehydrogenase [Anaerolineales bacterium]|nr:homoserine dehydrogenase [Anaerolineales bacterium]